MRTRYFLALCTLAVFLAGCGTTGIPSRRIVVPPQSSVHPQGYTPQAPPHTVLPFSVAPKHINYAGEVLIGNFEGYEACPYWDPYGHVWTRGYGETEGITSGSKCLSSRTEGLNRLGNLVETRYEWAIRGMGVNFNQNQWNALCSFAWNLGAGIFTGTLRYNLTHGMFFAAGQQMLQYVHAGGQVLQGLVTRRQAEVRLLLTPVAKEASPAPTHKQLQEKLWRDYRVRNELRIDRLHHNCAKPPFGRGKYHMICTRWTKHGNEIAADIKDLHKKGVR